MIRSGLNTALLLARTTRNLRPAQVVHRARLRAQRFPPSHPIAASLIALLPAGVRVPAGWPAAFTPLDLDLAEGFPSPEQNAMGRFAFLGEERNLEFPVRWDHLPGAARLWAYHLHYMEWAWSFARHSDRQWARQSFSALWRSWAASDRFGRGDRWSPYVASLRAWVLCGTYDTLSRDSDIQPAIDASLLLHARFLRWHMEHDVGGNHLVKNLKALVGLAVSTGDEDLLRRATRELRQQIPIQVLADGGHYERSPSYHCQVLGDFIDIASLLAASGRPPVPGLAEAISSMRAWLGIMLMPDGDVPLFNDGALVGQARVCALGPGPGPDRLAVLPASGYVVVRSDDRLHMVADVGDPCPPDLPAHAHADCLSFELAADGRRLVVDSGTSTYAPGPQRAYERSTRAHNTVVIDGANQTEVWSTFRAARLARGRLLRAEDDGLTVTVVASHDGYSRLPGSPAHTRTWRADTHVRISDEITGDGDHRVESRLHIARPGMAKLAWTGPPELRLSKSPVRYADGFGRMHDGTVASAAWQGTLPVSLQLDLHVGIDTDATKGKP
jgi:uncharacterized heparinase superfamily protein